jgi:hypothetical protein
MVQIFLNSDILAQIKAIQNNENLKDEREVIIRAIQNYSKKNDIDSTQQQNSFEDEISNTTFDGHIEMEKIRNILQHVTSENIIKKLPQHEIYKMPDAGMIHRFHTKILPVKFSLMCLSKMIIEQESPWIDLNEFKDYALGSAKFFIKKFDSSSIRNNFKIHTGFPISKLNNFKSDNYSYLSYARSSKRFTEQFVGRKLRMKEPQKEYDVQMGGALFEMGLIKAKSEIVDELHHSKKIYVTLSENGKEFVSYKNDLIDFIYNVQTNQPSSIFSQQEREFYFKKILPEFEFEHIFVKLLLEHKQIEHTSKIRDLFKKEFFIFCENKFDDVKFLNTLQNEAVRIRSNTIMGRLMEFGVFTKDPKSKSGPYTRMQNPGDFV